MYVEHNIVIPLKHYQYCIGANVSLQLKSTFTSSFQCSESDGWKCPACRNVTVHIPYVYKCFCGKSRDPPWEPGDTPHSCGEVCKRKRTNTNCHHPCNILCHPGPCPQCPANVKRSCVCGKTKQTVRCGAVPVLRCQKACNKLLNCAIHICEKVCHDDKCEECQITLIQGKNIRPKKSCLVVLHHRPLILENWKKKFYCTKVYRT